jgi:hypothetical protein
MRTRPVNGEVASAVTPEQTGLFAWAVRDTLDQYLTVANERGFTKRRQPSRRLCEHDLQKRQCRGAAVSRQVGAPEQGRGIAPTMYPHGTGI